MALNDSLKKLVEEYGLQQNQHPFLLVDLSGGKENTHTNILLSLLRFNDYMFFKSFLTDVLNVPDWNKEKSLVKISTQEPAVGLKTNKKTNGFIDLYIQYVDINNQQQIIVIENKINGAADTQKQMLRYIASVKINRISEPTAFDDWVEKTIIPSEGDKSVQDIIHQECLNRHFVYLTLDNSKVPEEHSLPSFLRNGVIIDYNPISYQDSILQWLTDTVLRSCPYYDDGLVVAGLRQYIASLEGLLSRNITISGIVGKYVSGVESNSKTINDAYNGLWVSIDAIENYSRNLSDDNEVETCNRLARELRKAAEELITKDSVPNGWALHLSPTLLVLYKPEWMRIARGSYSIPFVSLYSNPKNFLKGKKMTWQLHIEHFSPEKWREWDNKANGNTKLHSTNHDRTAFYELESYRIETPDASGRKKCVETVINDKANIIRIVDDVVDTIDSNKMTYTSDKEVRIALFNQLADSLP